MKTCLKCGIKFSLSKVPKKYLNKDDTKYDYCTFCRKYKKCEFCGSEFHHKQNMTCSMKCANDLKKLSLFKSCGAEHNFSKESSSRKKWESKLLEDEGIINVFQRESVKDKAKQKMIEKFGVDHISKSHYFKNIISEKTKDRIESNPNHYKDIWHESHRKFVDEIGYDPRLHVFGKASKSSKRVFDEVINWCLSSGIDYDDIYLGIDGKNEFFLRNGENFFMYDFTIKSKKLIIEYHGIAFHAKKKDDIWVNVFTNENAKQNIKKRKIKNGLAKSLGFKILEIWSDDDVSLNIEKCKKFISKNL